MAAVYYEKFVSNVLDMIEYVETRRLDLIVRGHFASYVRAMSSPTLVQEFLTITVRLPRCSGHTTTLKTLVDVLPGTKLTVFPNDMARRSSGMRDAITATTRTMDFLRGRVPHKFNYIFLDVSYFSEYYNERFWDMLMPYIDPHKTTVICL